uniref:Uncharacterized protein n=1 Tax=Angiostrongylus cantonensis TaxID=6313 RepID=A0A0K0DIB9_ANGCA
MKEARRLTDSSLSTVDSTSHHSIVTGRRAQQAVTHALLQIPQLYRFHAMLAYVRAPVLIDSRPLMRTHCVAMLS